MTISIHIFKTSMSRAISDNIIANTRIAPNILPYYIHVYMDAVK